MTSLTAESASEVLRESMRESVRRHSAWYLLQSVLMVLAGVLALVFPALSSVALVFYLGWILIFSGVIQAISLIDAHHVSLFWIQLISAALFVVVGLLFLRNPTAGAVSLTLLLIVFFMVEGFSKIILALTIRPFPNWGWVLLSGIVGIALSFFLLTRTPEVALWLLGVLLGIQLISEGVALGALAWRARRT